MLRKMVRTEMKKYKFILQGAGCGRYHLRMHTKKGGFRREAVVGRWLTLYGACVKVVELVDKVTVGGNDEHG